MLTRIIVWTEKVFFTQNGWVERINRTWSFKSQTDAPAGASVFLFVIELVCLLSEKDQDG